LKQVEKRLLPTARESYGRRPMTDIVRKSCGQPGRGRGKGAL
jgi:hypothetical protein